jgi:hypothetical protein
MNHIYLTREHGQWVATHFGPCGDRIQELFGTRTLPTAWSTDASDAEIRRMVSIIETRNPGVRVVLAGHSSVGAAS